MSEPAASREVAEVNEQNFDRLEAVIASGQGE